MVLISDGNSEIGANMLGKIDNLIWLKHLFGSPAVQNLELFSNNFCGCATCSKLPSDISYMNELQLYYINHIVFKRKIEHISLR